MLEKEPLLARYILLLEKLIATEAMAMFFYEESQDCPGARLSYIEALKIIKELDLVLKELLDS